MEFKQENVYTSRGGEKLIGQECICSLNLDNLQRYVKNGWNSYKIEAISEGMFVVDDCGAWVRYPLAYFEDKSEKPDVKESWLKNKAEDCLETIQSWLGTPCKETRSLAYEPIIDFANELGANILNETSCHVEHFKNNALDKYEAYISISDLKNSMSKMGIKVKSPEKDDTVKKLEDTSEGRMTNAELAKWLFESRSKDEFREVIANTDNNSFVSSIWYYHDEDANSPVDENVRIRVNGGYWISPLKKLLG